MKNVWKTFRVNMMYWRFRHVTRNRLRFQSWYRRRQPVRMPRSKPSAYRASASVVYRRSSRRTWAALLVMVVVLTALQYLGNHSNLGSSLIWGLSSLVVVGAIYWALRSI